MSYCDYDYYTELFGPIERADFARLSYDAERLVDAETTGLCGFRKLKEAFPTDEDDAEAVRRCVSGVISVLANIERAEKASAMATGYEVTENGLQGKVIASKSSGSESISYTTGGTGTKTAIEMAASDLQYRDNLIYSVIRRYLSGVRDANGVNLLYMGVYPL